MNAGISPHEPGAIKMHLPAPPRSPAQIRFPAAGGNVFEFPGLCPERRERGQSPSRGIGSRRRKCGPVSGLAELFPGRNSRRWQRPVRLSKEMAVRPSAPPCSGCWRTSATAGAAQAGPSFVARPQLALKRRSGSTVPAKINFLVAPSMTWPSIGLVYFADPLGHLKSLDIDAPR